MATKTILITGGAGFIGSHLVRYFVKKYPEYLIINYDALTYAGNLNNLQSIENASNYVFIRGDIRNSGHIEKVFQDYGITDVIHLAAESHVDRSIMNPLTFAETNIIGTLTLLNVSKNFLDVSKGHRFYHVSTDEVFGSLGLEGLFSESTSYDPRSPYSASKASSDHFVRAYAHTYQFPVVISNCSNNYGPNQFPEKLIPLMILNVMNDKELPVYGDGLNIRDWIHVDDHVQAMDMIFHKGRLGETYAVGSDNEQKNIDVVKDVIRHVDICLGRTEGKSISLIKYVNDRAGHDRRYAIDSSKIKTELGWTATTTWQKGIKSTVNWYLNNQNWINNILDGDYLKYYQDQYLNR